MNVEGRLIDALSEFDRVQPSRDLFARVEGSVERDRLHRRRVRCSAGSGAAAITSVVAFLALATDDTTGRIAGWAVFVAQLAVLVTAVVVLGRIIPRFGQIYVADVFRLDPATGPKFLRLQDVAYHLIFSGYVIVLSWHREMAGPVEATEAMRFLLDRTAGLFLLMGLLHAATLLTLPVIGLVFGTIAREHSRKLAGDAAPPEDPDARHAARVGRFVVWIMAVVIVIQFLFGFGLLAGLGIAGS